MAKTKREFIIATFIISCLATVVTIVCLSTQEWVLGDLKSNRQELKNGEINYGLFTGTFIERLSVVKRTSDITIACIFEENICGFSTKLQGNDRIQEIKNIVNDKSCKKNKKIEEYNIKLINNNTIYTYERNIDLFNDDTSTISLESDDTNIVCDKTFINTGLWLTTVIFLTFAIFMGAVTSTISVVNTASNPISPWFGIWGLYIYNIICIASLLMTLILWGSLYGAILSYNVGLIETVNGYYSNLNIGLGFSYWLILVPFVLHLVNLGLLYYRQYLINKEPEINEDKIEAQDRDGMIFVY